MVGVIAMSALAAAFAPVITKRLSKSISVSSGVFKELTAACANEFSEKCILCYKEDRCVMCIRSCADNEYKRIDVCQCEACAGRDIEKDPDSKCIKCSSEKCLKCEAGYGVHDGGCIKCGVEANGTLGMYSDGTTDCIQAREGHYVNQEGASTDTECSQGTYQPDKGKTSCIQADEGHYVDTQGATEQKECPEGTYQQYKNKTSCDDCPVGTYQNLSGQSICINCSKGQYQNYQKQTQCNNCGYGYYADVERSVNCKPAQPGHYVDILAAQNQTSCPKGTYQNLEAQTNCINCPKGKYINTTGNTSCINCIAGTYNDTDTSPTISCKLCGAGKWSNEGAITSSNESNGCYPCPIGYICSSQGGKSQCLAGTYAPQGSSSCTQCPAGTYSSSNGASACSNCGAGKYSTGGASVCTNCANGKWTDSQTASSCTGACPAGNKCVNGTITTCTAGTYAPSGSSSCTNCASGYGSNAGAGSCKKCTDFHAKCTACNGSKCTACATGYKVDGTGCVEEFSCNDDNFFRVGNLCVTRKNMFDSSVLQSSGASVHTGQTSWGCSAGGSPYSGCGRAVISDYWGAVAVCANFKYKNKTWRLPTKEEALTWKSPSVHGKNGLRLCASAGSGDVYALCGEHPDSCNGTCQPARVWTSSLASWGPDEALFVEYPWSDAVLSFTDIRNNTGCSVRCVTNWP